ncbi:glycosyl hydrolase family 61-domain-containing protein [Infundibulicybe gibba]|nr:glycosyl hydrolase family 61-domain-containing protein [Infundibulicybe gibba]
MSVVLMSSPSLFFFLVFTLFFSTRTVNGHGYVHSVIANGQTYPGWNPFSDPYTTTPPKIVRKVLNDGFVAAGDPDLACHHGGKQGTGAVAEAAAGSQVTFQWSYWPSDHQGPVSTYMASCNGDCTTFSTDGAKWFKLDAAGYFDSDRQWAADKLRANNNSWVSTIPAGLAPGQYVTTKNHHRPQFYPSCSQLKVTGTGNGQPSQQDVVSIPELYNGVKFPNIYTDFGSFTIPGPPPITLTGGGSQPPRAATELLSTGSQKITNTPSASGTPVSTTKLPNHCLLASRRMVRRRSLLKRHS